MHGGCNAKIGCHTSKMRAPVFDFQSLLKALLEKKGEVHSDGEAFKEHCAKRWQTRDGTYQLKRRLKPDLGDPPKNESADVDVADIRT